MQFSPLMPDPKGASRAARILAGDAMAQIKAALDHGGVLAVLAHVEGGFYRSVGALMHISAEGQRTGALSAGCVDHDIALHAQEVARGGQMRRLRYGVGSEFADLRLPCGGAIEVDLWPVVQLDGLAQTVAQITDRQSSCLTVPSGAHYPIEPDLRIALYGAGEDAATFAAVSQAAGYDLSAELPLEQMSTWVDPRTAVVVMLHDHEKEDAILIEALRSRAFWIGAMGSERANAQRLGRLRAAGLSTSQLARIHGPIGLIPAQREPRGLAVSILADVAASFACI